MQYYESTVQVKLAIHATIIKIYLVSKRAGENRMKLNFSDKSIIFFYKDAKP